MNNNIKELNIGFMNDGNEPVKAKTDAKLGCPTKYKQEHCKMMIDYFNIEVMREVKVAGKEGAFETRYVLNTFPTIARFARKIGVCRDTLYEWAAKKDDKGSLVHPEFSDTLTRARDLQETLMIEGGLSGAYEFRFLIFLAPKISRLKNKVEAKVGITAIKSTTDALDKIYAKNMDKMKVTQR